MDGDKERLRCVQHELKRRQKQAKVDYKNKVERKLQHNNIKEVWKGMRSITRYKKKNSQTTEVNVDKASEFNQFFNRFDRVAGICPASAGTVSPILPPTTTLDTTSAVAYSPVST